MEQNLVQSAHNDGTELKVKSGSTKRKREDTQYQLFFIKQFFILKREQLSKSWHSKNNHSVP